MKNNSNLILAVCFVSLVAGCNNNKFSFHDENQNVYLKAEYFSVNKFASGKKEQSLPSPYILEWEDTGCKSYEVHLKSKNGVDERMIRVITNKAEIYNLSLETSYEYTISPFAGKGTFNTYDVKWRNLYVPGIQDPITNFRDIGGWETNDKKKLPQGMLYRSAKFSEDKTGKSLIDEDGIKVLTEGLHIKTEIDLRDTKDNEYGGLEKSVIGEKVQYIHCPFKSGGNYLTLNKTKMNDFFQIVSNRDNYPIDIHCSIGTDRTGLVFFFMECLLDVVEEDVYRDYLLSNFANINGTRSFTTIDNYIKEIKTTGQNSLKDCAYSYLKTNCGVDEKYLKNFIQIMKAQ